MNSITVYRMEWEIKSTVKMLRKQGYEVILIERDTSSKVAIVALDHLSNEDFKCSKKS